MITGYLDVDLKRPERPSLMKRMARKIMDNSQFNTDSVSSYNTDIII
jgi:hypothetical protein